MRPIRPETSDPASVVLGLELVIYCAYSRRTLTEAAPDRCQQVSRPLVGERPLTAVTAAVAVLVEEAGPQETERRRRQNHYGWTVGCASVRPSRFPPNLLSR